MCTQTGLEGTGRTALSYSRHKAVASARKAYDEIRFPLPIEPEAVRMPKKKLIKIMHLRSSQANLHHVKATFFLFKQIKLLN